MDTMCEETPGTTTATAQGLRRRLGRRLRPLGVATFIQGLGFWVPVEKLFMSEIGFDAAAVGVMAAVYAAATPILEVPAGIVSDRWSRRAVLMGASLAIAASALVGGLSHGVETYLIGAVLLGAYFALYSGAMDSMVYDTVLEETGDGARFEKEIGRIRAIESAAFVTSALLGGWLAELTSPRLMYFLTVPFAILSISAYAAFREPRLHQVGEPLSLRRHVAATVATVRSNPAITPIVTLTIVCSTSLTLLLEFGPLWLVALGTSAVFFGPHWAVLMSTLGFGGLLAGRVRLDAPRPLAAVSAALVSGTIVLTTSHHVVVLTLAQGVLALLVVIAGIHANALLHHEIDSSIRASVASGVSAVSWIVFLPVALVFGGLAQELGIHAAAWLLVGLACLIVGTLARRLPVPDRVPS